MYPLDASERSDLDLRAYVSVLRRRKWSILVVMVAVLALAGVLSYRQTRVYEATAVLLLRADTADAVISNGAAVDPVRRLGNEAELVTSGATETEAVERLGHSASVSVNVGDTSDTIELTASSTDPDEAALIANTYSEAHRDVRRNQDLEDLTRARDEVATKLSEENAAILALTQTIADLNGQIAATPDPTQQAGLRSQLESTTRDRDATLASRDTYSERLGALQIAQEQASSQTRLQILTRAEPPSSPSSPDYRQNFLVALLMGALLGIAWAVARDYFDDSVRGPEDLERSAGGAPTLASIPRVKGSDTSAPAVVTATAPMSHAAEAYRALRTSVEFVGLESGIQTLQVTSAVAGEGKTTIVSNLAVAFAQTGERIVLLDCDLRRPRVHEYFDLDRTVGFTAVTLGKSSLEAVIQRPRGIEGLDVICTGPLPPNPSELLRNNRFSEMLQHLLIDHSLVLIDCPPVLAVTDALVISRVCDATLFVCSSGSSSKRQVKRGLQSLRQVNSPLIGTVLNRARPDGAYGYQDYSYYNAASAKNGRGPEAESSGLAPASRRDRRQVT